MQRFTLGDPTMEEALDGVPEVSWTGYLLSVWGCGDAASQTNIRRQEKSSRAMPRLRQEILGIVPATRSLVGTRGLIRRHA